MTETGIAMGAFLLTLGIMLGLTVPAYIRFFRLLAEGHPETYERLGRPTILSRSPRQSLWVQKFLYRGYKTVGASDELVHLCRHLGRWTPVFLALLAVEFGWLVFAALRMARG